ncbi:MAG: hypothetical protein KAW56_12930 [Candidatus Marinimicrobia bacterium]|nr:hypothetical protein [Candidatus Neomarinimicrobiota bacterium]
MSKEKGSYIIKKYNHAWLAFKAIDRIDLIPSGLVRLCSAYINRLYRMLFMLIPLRGFMKRIKDSQIVREFILRYEPRIYKKEMKMSKFSIIFILSFALILSQCEAPSSTDDGDDFDAPAVPTGLDIIIGESGDGEIALSWNENSEKDFDGYRLYRASNTNEPSAYSLVIETPATNYKDTCLDYDTTYYYRVSAYDDNGNESEKSSSVYIQPINVKYPAAPIGFKVYGYNLPFDDPKIELEWQNNIETDFSHYNIYRATLALFLTDSSHFVINTTENYFTDIDVEVGTKYYYKISSLDKGLLESVNDTVKSDLPLPETVLTSPDSSSTVSDLNPTFIWEKAENATHYEVIVQPDPYGTATWTGMVNQPAQGNSVQTTYPSNSSTTPLESNTVYYWRVAAYSSDNVKVNSYSILWKFRTP